MSEPLANAEFIVDNWFLRYEDQELTTYAEKRTRAIATGTMMPARSSFGDPGGNYKPPDEEYVRKKVSSLDPGSKFYLKPEYYTWQYRPGVLDTIRKHMRSIKPPNGGSFSNFESFYPAQIPIIRQTELLLAAGGQPFRINNSQTGSGKTILTLCQMLLSPNPITLIVGPLASRTPWEESLTILPTIAKALLKLGYRDLHYPELIMFTNNEKGRLSGNVTVIYVNRPPEVPVAEWWGTPYHLTLGKEIKVMTSYMDPRFDDEGNTPKTQIKRFLPTGLFVDECIQYIGSNIYGQPAIISDLTYMQMVRVGITLIVDEIHNAKNAATSTSNYMAAMSYPIVKSLGGQRSFKLKSDYYVNWLYRDIHEADLDLLNYNKKLPFYFEGETMTYFNDPTTNKVEVYETKPGRGTSRALYLSSTISDRENLGGIAQVLGLRIGSDANMAYTDGERIYRFSQKLLGIIAENVTLYINSVPSLRIYFGDLRLPKLAHVKEYLESGNVSYMVESLAQMGIFNGAIFTPSKFKTGLYDHFGKLGNEENFLLLHRRLPTREERQHSDVVSMKAAEEQISALIASVIANETKTKKAKDEPKEVGYSIFIGGSFPEIEWLISHCVARRVYQSLQKGHRVIVACRSTPAIMYLANFFSSFSQAQLRDANIRMAAPLIVTGYNRSSVGDIINLFQYWPTLPRGEGPREYPLIIGSSSQLSQSYSMHDFWTPTQKRDYGIEYINGTDIYYALQPTPITTDQLIGRAHRTGSQSSTSAYCVNGGLYDSLDYFKNPSIAGIVQELPARFRGFLKAISGDSEYFDLTDPATSMLANHVITDILIELYGMFYNENMKQEAEREERRQKRRDEGYQVEEEGRARITMVFDPNSPIDVARFSRMLTNIVGATYQDICSYVVQELAVTSMSMGTSLASVLTKRGEKREVLRTMTSSDRPILQSEEITAEAIPSSYRPQDNDLIALSINSRYNNIPVKDLIRNEILRTGRGGKPKLGAAYL